MPCQCFICKYFIFTELSLSFCLCFSFLIFKKLFILIWKVICLFLLLFSSLQLGQGSCMIYIKRVSICFYKDFYIVFGPILESL